MWHNQRLAKVVILFLGFLWASVSAAQDWQDMAAFPVHEAAPYFINEDYGFVFTSGSVGPVYDVATDPIALWRTTDRGFTWQAMNLGTTGLGNIWQLCFVTPSHGYMATDAIGGGNNMSAHGLFETTDSGLHWNYLRTQNRLFAYENFISIYAADSSLYTITAEIGKLPVTLWKSSDAGFSWKVDTSVVSPELITGNRESLLEASGPDGGYYLDSSPDSVIFTSSNDAQMWSVHSGYSEQWNQFVFPHSQTIMLAVESYAAYSSAVIVSTDGGSNWSVSATAASAYRTNAFGWAIDAIAGDGCAAYVQRTFRNTDSAFGCLRSTDNGQTWVNVGGPTHECDARTLSVVGHGAVVYAIADSIPGIPVTAPGGGCHLWKTTDGGDGLLSSVVNSTVTMGDTLLTGASANNTLTTKLCDTASLSLWLQFTADCDYGGLSGVTIDGIDSTTAGYTIASTHHPWSQNLPDTAMVTILPQTPGTYPLTIHAHYTDDDFLQGDTTFHVTLIIQPNPGVLTVAPSNSIDFGTQALCAPVTVQDTFKIAAHGCEQVTVDSIVFHADSAQFTDFTFTNVGSFIPDSSPNNFPISFKPSIADTERGSIFIYWFDGSVQHVDTIQTQGVGVTDTRTFAIRADTLSLRLCDSTTGTIYITNTTCGTLTLDSLTLPNGVILAPGMNPAFPIVLAPGAPDSVIVHLALGGAGTAPLQVGDTTLQATASMQFTEHGSTSAFDTTLTLNIRVGRGNPAASLSTTSLNFGSVSTCGQSITLPMVIASTGCDTLTCSSAVPALPFTLTRSFLSTVAVGTIDTALVTFTPTQSGSFYDTLVINTNAGTETVPLHGVGVAGASILSADSSLRNFGALYECQSRDTTITLSNTGCDTLSIDSGFVSNGTYTTNAVYPIILPPDSSANINLHLTADSAGMNGTIEFFSNANQGSSTVTIPVTASIIPPARLVLDLSPSDTATDGDTVTCYVLLEGNVPNGAISSFQFDITHNDDLLTYESTSSVTKTGSAGTAQLQTLQFSVRVGSRAGSPTYADTLGMIKFQAYLSDSSSTPLALSNVSFTNTLSLAPDCIASIVDSERVVHLSLQMWGSRSFRMPCWAFRFPLLELFPIRLRMRLLLGCPVMCSPALKCLMRWVGDRTCTARPYKMGFRWMFRVYLREFIFCEYRRAGMWNRGV